MGYSFSEILMDQLTRKTLGHDAIHAERTPFIRGVQSRLSFLLTDPTKHLSFLKIGYTALEAFLQANVTGPPLDFNPEPLIFPEMYRDEHFSLLKQEIFESLAVDSDAVYALTPHIELFWLAKVIMSNATLADAGFNGRRARFRVNFWHQKLLQEKSDRLQEQLYKDAEVLGDQLSKRLYMRAAAAEQHFIEFLLERAAIRIFYGDDTKAREDLAQAASIRDFQFALTGALGKRTKFQDRDISQLVVLARSRDFEPEPYNSRKSSRADPSSRKSSAAEPRSPFLGHRPGTPASSIAAESMEGISPNSGRKISLAEEPNTQPENLPLNDDTLHENIQFSQIETAGDEIKQIKEKSTLHPDLTEMDPGNQPVLFPVDSIILLSLASSISNTSPTDGLIREETLPYASRVLEGGSSNWQVYTQALLVRSRIEGYKSRTAERGLLQLQALVDQVIAETAGTAVTSKKGDEADEQTSNPSTFLPKLSVSESANVAERLKYIYQLSPPLRWELEAELAHRWTQMGGLRTALEIYERLQMQAEVALCLAATDRDAEAVKLLKSIVFEDPNASIESTPKIKSPQPPDTSRLLCILGDVLQEPKYYVLAWTVSHQRYARAQRSLGKYFSKKGNIAAAAEAYTSALQITRLDNSTWFALGCIQLEQEEWQGAVESFTRVVQLEDRDAEGWSNLAVALLKLPPPVQPETSTSETQPTSQDQVEVTDFGDSNDNDNEDDTTVNDDETNEDYDEDYDDQLLQPSTPSPYQHTYEALRALRRAATLKRDDARIWDNYLTVAASIPPGHGTPWLEIVQAMGRVIDLRGKKEGEGAIDLKILEALINHVSESFDYPRDNEAGVADTTEESTKPNGAESTSSPTSNLTTEPNTTTTPSQPPRLPYLATSLLTLISSQILPLTTSPHLYLLLSKLSLWRHRPAESLSFVEKAWRASTAHPDAYTSEPQFLEVVDVTAQLVEAYRALGERERERTGGVVERNWRFKARSCVRGVIGRSGEWEGGEGWRRLEALMEGL